jgi:hypothetical protein
MSHVPNISFREALGLGSVGTLGRCDAAAPDNPFLPLRTPGTTDRCSAHEAAPGMPGSSFNPEEAREIFWSGLSGGQGALAAQAYQLPTPQGMPGKLTQQDFVSAAGALKCEVAAVKAVAEVEAKGSGFLGDGRPKILFEASYFSALTKGIYDKLYPDISSPFQKRSLYLGGAKEYERLEEALALDARAALKSASWGAFQIMGRYHDMAGFADVEAFVAAMYKGEGEHLKACVAFIQSKKITRALQNKDWAAFAKGYNGSGYKANEYDTKLAKAYAKYAGAAAGGTAKPAPGSKPQP